MSTLIPGFYNPDTNDDIYQYTDWSAVQYDNNYLKAYSEKIFTSKYILKQSEEVIITDVDIEHSYSFGKTADAMITVKHNDGSISEIAYEIRYAHKKDYNDVGIYAENKINVIECYIKDLPLDDENIKHKLSKRLLGYDNNKNYMEWLTNDCSINDFITEYNSYSFEWFIGAYELLYHNGEYACCNDYVGINKNNRLTEAVSNDLYMEKLGLNKNIYDDDKLPFGFFSTCDNHLMIINHPSVFINGDYTKQHLFIMISKTGANTNSNMSKIPDFLKAISRITPYSDKQDKIDEYIAKPCYHDADNYDWLTIIPYECESCHHKMITWCNKNTPFDFIDYLPKNKKHDIIDIQYENIYSIIKQFYKRLPLNYRKNKDTYAKYVKFLYAYTYLNNEDCHEYNRNMKCPYCSHLFPLQNIIDKFNRGEGLSISYLKTHDVHNMNM